jgi:signal transduction histidine kinase
MPPGPKQDGPLFTGEHLVLFHKIIFDGERIGTVYLTADLKEMYSRLTQYAGIVAVVMLASSLVAFLVSSVVQRVISGPIHHLADTASRVSNDKNYSIRAVKTAEDELGVLVDRFNEMMAQIDARNIALQEAQNELEGRVRERTTDLEIEIAQRKRIQEDLLAAKQAAEESNRAKSVFLANMSHELRTPLNAIIGYSEMLQEEAEDAGQQDLISDLQKINSSGKHLLMLINDVLDLSKIEAGKMELQMEPFEISQMVKDVATAIGPLAKKQGNTFVVKYENCQGTMYADVLKFRQSLLNLLSNACKFTENGTVTLEVARERVDDREWINWHVRDTGIGIAPEDKMKLFKSFSQLDSSATRKHEGTGLGLSISRKFCRMMGGDITVESTPGKGTAFTMRLPALTEADSMAAPLPALLREIP